MGALNNKLRSAILRPNGPGMDSVLFWCPGCDQAHAVQFGEGMSPRWGYNGNPDAPTFTPSLLIRHGHYVPGEPQPPNCYLCNTRDPDDMACSVCHSFVTNGQIQFLGDCTHALAGQTVPIPDWPR